MQKTRIVCAPSNFAPGRPAGMRPEAIVLHRTGGTADELRVRFLDFTQATSAHYVVCKDGSVVQYVAEEDTAFHAGLVINPTWKGVKPNVNPNFYTIGIELEGSAGDPVPDAQSDACAALVAEVSARCAISIDEYHIVLHSEIRASRNCPGAPFARDEFIRRALLAATLPSVFPSPTEVNILKDTNVREGLPSPAARVVSVLRAGTKIRVNAFTLRGDAVNGNSAWYQAEDGNFFWAGNSSIPEPRPEPDNRETDVAISQSSTGPATEPPDIPSRFSPASCLLGITEIDQFFTATSCAPLELAKSGREAIGVIQDLLTGHGFAKLPSILSPAYGTCGDSTRTALADFQNGCGLPAAAVLTQETLKQLIGRPAKDPRATGAHFALVLGIPFTGIYRVLALTAQMEGAGKFAALNLNTDFAGLSFGLIQWAQAPGRLLEIVSAFRDADSGVYARIFGDSDAALADGLIAHLKKPFGGVIHETGVTTDPRFNLIASPWVDRFRQAALEPGYQKTQVKTARNAFEASLTRLRQYDTAKLVRSERAVAFMLDVANQFGDGRVQRPVNAPDRGLAGIYRRVFRQDMTEQDLLQAIGDATVEAMPPRFQPGVRARRNLFLQTPLLSGSGEFKEATSGQA